MHVPMMRILLNTGTKYRRDLICHPFRKILFTLNFLLQSKQTFQGSFFISERIKSFDGIYLVLQLLHE